MIRHEAVRMDLDPESVHGLADEIPEQQAIFDIEEDGLSIDTSAHDVVPCPSRVVSLRSAHVAIVTTGYFRLLASRDGSDP